MFGKCGKSYVLKIVLLLILLSSTAWAGPPPMPARIGGTVTVGGTQITQYNDNGYTFVVKRVNGTGYVPAAQDTDGLNSYNYYIIDIPLYESESQPGGANPGDTAVIHAYKNGVELNVTSPSGGLLTVGSQGSTTVVNLVIQLPPPSYVFIGSTYASGNNNRVKFYGLNNGQCTRGYATCRGNWWVHPCNWQSSCSTGWEYNPADYYAVSSSYCNCN